MNSQTETGSHEAATHRSLSGAEINRFVEEGFVRIDEAFSSETAAEAREILWRETGCDPNDRSTWKQPVIRLADLAQEPFRRAAKTPVLHRAFDQLVGEARWMPRESLGMFLVRFPHRDDPGDAGWHVDSSFPPDPPVADYMQWRINVRSKGRSLLMLFLFSDVGDPDAPTRIRIGSHLTVARILAPAGEQGMSTIELANKATPATKGMKECLATGKAGTVYLCHPFLVHASQPNRVGAPRFMAQPPLMPRVPFELARSDGAYSPVETAIRMGLNLR
ncbi:MAG TPA: phytanoyl-CoA dioxygenase family protein [Terracidiphilus sp.]|nr:phytanoyl-CoA dioxygenase family protein [Terracidiphilus sp.]